MRTHFLDKFWEISYWRLTSLSVVLPASKHSTMAYSYKTSLFCLIILCLAITGPASAYNKTDKAPTTGKNVSCKDIGNWTSENTEKGCEDGNYYSFQENTTEYNAAITVDNRNSTPGGKSQKSRDNGDGEDYIGNRNSSATQRAADCGGGKCSYPPSGGIDKPDTAKKFRNTSGGNTIVYVPFLTSIWIVHLLVWKQLEYEDLTYFYIHPAQKNTTREDEEVKFLIIKIRKRV